MYGSKIYAKKSAEWWNGLTHPSLVHNIKLWDDKSETVLHHYICISLSGAEFKNWINYTSLDECGFQTVFLVERTNAYV